MSGVTSGGFVPATYEELLQEQQDSFQEQFGPEVDLSTSSPFGLLVPPLADSLAALWEGLAYVDKATDVTSAEGVQLDALCALTGTVRLPATYSTAGLTCTGTPGATIAAGAVVSNGTLGGDRYEVTVGATLAAATVWAPATAYLAGVLVTADAKVYVALTTGTSGGVGPSGTGVAIADGTVTWRYLGDGTAVGGASAKAQETGPKLAVAFTLTTIETPASGWYGVANLLDVVPGRDTETDAALRLRRVAELASGGKATEPALRAALTNPDTTPGVTSVAIFVNDADVTDGDGLPPHSFEALVEGGLDVDVARTIWGTKALGIQTHGTVTQAFTDDVGVSRTVKFSRPTLLTVWVRVTLEVTADYPVDGDARVKARVAGQVHTDTGLVPKVYALGENVVATERGGMAYGVQGVYRVVQVELGLTMGGLAVVPELLVLPRERAILDTTRVLVVTTPATTAP